MNEPARDDRRYRSTRGARTAAKGTPFAVDVSRDRRARSTWVVFLGGALIAVLHFAVVYLVAEAGCTGDGPGLEPFDPPVPRVVTLVATGVAAAGCVATARLAYRRWSHLRGAAVEEARLIPGEADDPTSQTALAFAGFLLSLLAFLTVLFVGLPAVVLGC